MPSSKFSLSPAQLQALHNGDRQVFKLIFEAFQPRLYRFLYLKVRNTAQAEDLVQETFFRFWQARTQLRSESGLEVYLFRIAANLTTDFFRRAKLPTTPLATEALTLPSPQTAESSHEYEQLAQTIAAVVASLPEGPRTAFSLSRYEGLSYAEIAEVMGLSVKTVEKHLGKALHVLRERLGRSSSSRL